jgi:hypothetical protein
VAHDRHHDTKRTPESMHLGPGHPGDPGLLGHGLPPLFATEVPDYSETGVFYEKEDTNPAAIIKVGVILAVTTILSVVVTFGVYYLFARLEDRAEVAPPALWQKAPGALPPEPRLQTSPFGDLERLRAEERGALTTYGWVDKQAGVVRIPIEEAIRRTVQSGGAAVPGAPAAGSVAVPVPGAGAAPAALSPSPAGTQK